ncbi:MAG: glutathione S-transferase N-terminal domain-containing protein [Pseudomonadota bacterium]
MELWYSPASPFVRKVLVTCHESGLTDRMKIHEVDTNVIDSDAELRSHNPLGKIPALMLDSGETLFDSRVICAYLDDLNARPKLTPSEPEARFRAMTLEALADGIMDAAVNTRYEMALRPEEYRWQGWVAGQFQKIDTGLDGLEERYIDDLNGDLSIGAISAGCALGYLNFRFPENDWTEKRPRLSSWYKAFSQRPSMEKTAP